MTGLSSWVEILPDFSKLDPRVRSHLTSTLGDAGTASAGSFGSSFKSSVGTIFTGNFLADIAAGAARQVGELIGTGIRAGIDYGVGGITLASDLNEALNANKVTFGQDIADQLKALGTTAPQRLALTQKAFASFSTQFAAFAKTIRGNDPVGFIDELTTRGADFASVYNLEVSDALALFQSGLAGETEPLRRFGLDLSAASVEAYAYANGIGVVGTELTEAEKVQARYGLLLASTSQVAGDATNTAGELAGQQRRLAVGLEEAQTQLGTYLLPGFLQLVTAANEKVIPAIGGIIERIGPKLGDALTELAPKFDDLLASAGPAIDKLTEAGIEGLPGLIDGATEAIGAIAALIEWAQQMDTEFTESTTSLNELYDTLLKAPEYVIEAIGFILAAPISNGAPEKLRANSHTLLKNLFGPLDERLPQMRERGLQAGHGFAQGITASEPYVTEAAEALGNAAIGRMRLVLDSHSPSRVFAAIGSDVGQGLILGIDGERGNVASSIASLITVPTATPSSLSLSGGTGGAGMYVGALSPEDRRLLEEGNRRPVQLIVGADVLAKKTAEEMAQQSQFGKY